MHKMHSLGPFAVCCYSVFKDHPSHLFLQGNRAAQGRDKVRNLTKSKQPVNNFLTPSFVLLSYIYCTTFTFRLLLSYCSLHTSFLHQMAHFSCAPPGNRGKILNHAATVNQKNEIFMDTFHLPARQHDKSGSYDIPEVSHFFIYPPWKARGHMTAGKDFCSIIPAAYLVKKFDS